MLNFFKKKVKKMDLWDIALIKMGVVAGVLFIITMWSSAMDLVLSINPWYFLIAFVILVIRPFYRYYIK